jgi:hypothetical protein
MGCDESKRYGSGSVFVPVAEKKIFRSFVFNGLQQVALQIIDPVAFIRKYFHLNSLCRDPPFMILFSCLMQLGPLLSQLDCDLRLGNYRQVATSV